MLSICKYLDISDDELVNLFSPYGSIITKNVLKENCANKFIIPIPKA